MKKKRYPFTQEGFEQMQKDYKKKKVDRIMDIGIYSIMVGLVVTGNMATYTLLKIVCCTMTSKGVKYVMQR